MRSQSVPTNRDLYGVNFMRRFFNLFGRIKSFEIVTLHISGMMPQVTEYEIVKSGGNAEISQYAVEYNNGEKVRQLQKSAVCSAEDALEMMNKCRLILWDGFRGKRPAGVKDGTDFTFKATVNKGKEIYAAGSQRFPKHYGDFTVWLRETLNGK